MKERKKKPYIKQNTIIILSSLIIKLPQQGIESMNILVSRCELIDSINAIKKRNTLP